jgi:hypothetical protein
MKQLINEIHRMQQLAGVVNEGQLNEDVSPELTSEEKVYLEKEIEQFLNTALFSSDIVANDSPDFSPTKEERAIQYIIDTLTDRISRY